MAVLPIRITGDPVLHRPARQVSEFDSSLDALVHDMVDTMEAAPGVGLAGPQVGVGLSIFVWRYRGGARFDARYEGETGGSGERPALDSLGDPVDLHSEGGGRRGVVVNPRLLISPVPVRAPEAECETEGCLSVPGHQFPLVRAERAVLSGVDVHGRPVEVRAWGWLARIFQHEFDHLRGTLYVDRLAEPWAGQAQRIIEDEGWGAPGNSWTPQP